MLQTLLVVLEIDVTDHFIALMAFQTFKKINGTILKKSM